MDKLISETISNRRKFLQLTQEALAERSGISLRSLKSMERGEGNPTIAQINKVLAVLGMKLTIVMK